MAQLQPPDSHHLLAALGWLELGVPAEASGELAKIATALQEHPDVLDVRWNICARQKNWEAALLLAEQLVSVAPGRSSGTKQPFAHASRLRS